MSFGGERMQDLRDELSFVELLIGTQLNSIAKRHGVDVKVDITKSWVGLDTVPVIEVKLKAIVEGNE
jgi:hypothetical protein